MKRNAILYRSSKNGRKAFYIDEENADEILNFLQSKSAYAKKFKMILELLLEHNRPPRDLYDKENFEKGCEKVTAMKPAKGKQNPRIYCQQYTDNENEIFVIVAAELLIKKKSEGLSENEKSIIRKVASYQFKLTKEKR